jgi:hypothetical protein
LFADKQQRQQAIAAYGNLSAATLDRARSWAILVGLTLFDSGLVDHPQHAKIGRQILHTVVEN